MEAMIGIRDYSVKSYDANNIAYLNKKDNVKIMTFKLVLDQVKPIGLLSY